MPTKRLGSTRIQRDINEIIDQLNALGEGGTGGGSGGGSGEINVQTAGCIAYSTIQQTVGDSFVQLYWTNERFDNAEMWSPAKPNAILCPEQGYYQVQVSLRFDFPGTTSSGWIYVVVQLYDEITGDYRNIAFERRYFPGGTDALQDVTASSKGFFWPKDYILRVSVMQSTGNASAFVSHCDDNNPYRNEIKVFLIHGLVEEYVPRYVPPTYSFPYWGTEPDPTTFCTAFNSLQSSQTEIGEIKFYFPSSVWGGGALAPNGCIYIMPRWSDNNNVIKIDTSNDTYSFVTLPSASVERYYGATLAPNECIYAAPDKETRILKINTQNDAVTLISISDVNTSYTKWRGAVTGFNGCVYFIPALFDKICKINPVNDSYILFGNFGVTSSTKWFGGVLAFDGCIYCIPFDSSSILVINTRTDANYTFGSVGTDTAKWMGGAISPYNGCIYTAPYNSSYVLKINPETRSTSTIVCPVAGTFKYSGAILGPNGYIYCVPFYAEPILRIDPRTDTCTTIGGYSGTAKWAGGLLAPNGVIYMLTSYNRTVLKFLSNWSLDPNLCLSPFINRAP